MQKDKTKGKEGNLTKIIGVAAAIILFALVYALVPVSESGLKPEGKAALAVFLGAFALWISEPFPTYVVAFVTMIALILTNMGSKKRSWRFWIRCNLVNGVCFHIKFRNASYQTR